MTGDWPPNSHAGKSFIHDPKVANETEVKAQIKLQCRTVLGKPFVVVRSFQLTRKAGGKYEFKARQKRRSSSGVGCLQHGLLDAPRSPSP